MPKDASGAAPAPPGGSYAGLLAALCFISVIGPMATFLYLPALPEVARVFGTDEAGVQRTLTAFLAGSCLGYALLGSANDRFGPRPVFAGAMVLFILGSLAAALAPGLGWLILARLVQGVGASVGVITARATIRQTFPNGGSEGMAMLSAMTGMAPAASPIIGALVLLVADWRASFVGVALLGLAALVLALRILPKRVPARTPGPAATSAPPAPQRQSALRLALSHPETRAALIMGSLHNGTFMVMMAGSPFIFVESFGWSPLAYSLLFGVILTVFAVLSILSGKAFPRHGLRKVTRAGLPGMAVGALIQLAGAITQSPAAIALGLLIMIGSMGPIVPGNHMRMLGPFPAMAGALVGISMLTVTGTGVLLIWAYGLVSQGSVLGYGLWIAGLTLTAVLFWLRYPPAEPG